MSQNQLLIKVEIESAFVETRSGISSRNGKPYEIHSQKAWFYLGSKFPKEVQLPLDSQLHAWPVGLYVTDVMPALDAGDFGRLDIDMRKIRLLSQAEAAKPSVRAAG